MGFVSYRPSCSKVTVAGSRVCSFSILQRARVGEVVIEAAREERWSGEPRSERAVGGAILITGDRFGLGLDSVKRVEKANAGTVNNYIQNVPPQRITDYRSWSKASGFNWRRRGWQKMCDHLNCLPQPGQEVSSESVREVPQKAHTK